MDDEDDSGVGERMRQFYLHAYDEQAEPDLCFGDQLVESFADWLGTEAAALYVDRNTHFTPAQYRDGWANVWRVACQLSGPTKEVFSEAEPFPHPAIGARVDAILAANPIVRRQMGCPETNAKYEHCSMTQNSGNPPRGDGSSDTSKASR